MFLETFLFTPLLALFKQKPCLNLCPSAHGTDIIHSQLPGFEILILLFSLFKQWPTVVQSSFTSSTESPMSHHQCLSVLTSLYWPQFNLLCQWVYAAFQNAAFIFFFWTKKISSSCPLPLAESTNCSIHSAPFIPNPYFLFKVCILTRISTHSPRQLIFIHTLLSAMASPPSRDSSVIPSLYLSNLTWP